MNPKTFENRFNSEPMNNWLKGTSPEIYMKALIRICIVFVQHDIYTCGNKYLILYHLNLMNNDFQIRIPNKCKVGGGPVLMWMTILLLHYERKFMPHIVKPIYILETYNFKNKSGSVNTEYNKNETHMDEKFIKKATKELKDLTKLSVLSKILNLCFLKFFKSRIAIGVGNQIDVVNKNDPQIQLLLGFKQDKVNKDVASIVNYSCLNLDPSFGGSNYSSRTGCKLLTLQNNHFNNQDNLPELSKAIEESETLLRNGKISKPIYQQSYYNGARYAFTEDMQLKKNKKNSSFVSLFLSSTTHLMTFKENVTSNNNNNNNNNDVNDVDNYADAAAAAAAAAADDDDDDDDDDKSTTGIEAIDLAFHRKKIDEYTALADLNYQQFMTNPGARLECTYVISTDNISDTSFDEWFENMLNQCLTSNLNTVHEKGICLPLVDIGNYVCLTQGINIGAYRISLEMLPKVENILDSFTIKQLINYTATFLCVFYRGLALTYVDGGKLANIKPFCKSMAKFLGRSEYGLFPTLPRYFYKYFQETLSCKIDYVNYLQNNEVIFINKRNENTQKKRKERYKNFLNGNSILKCYKCYFEGCTNCYFVTVNELHQHLYLNPTHKIMCSSYDKVLITKDTAETIMKNIYNMIVDNREMISAYDLFREGKGLNIMGISGK